MTTIDKNKLVEEANALVPPSPNYVTVLYGDYGSRKTTTACSLIGERGLLISSDDSYKVLLNPRHKHLYDKVKDSIITYQGLSQLEYIDFAGYDKIIWDTVSHSVDMYLDLLHDHAKWGGNLREKITTTHPELKGLENLGFADYRVTRDSFRPILNKFFKNTDAHIVFTSQMREPIPSMGANQQKRPSIPEATFKIIGTRADVIAWCRPNGSKFSVDVTNSLTQLGKSRIEGIQGQMDPELFVNKYKEIAF
jgi:hypothetical protein